ncbi:MAG TPA: formylglycine-generating enzyme family protein, partial [Rhodanobacter sp.]
MPSNATLRRQRALGGALGIVVLGGALTYHFFPRVFHVEPTQAPPRSMSMGATLPGNEVRPEQVPAIAELNAGPPLTLAPTAVIVALSHKNADLPRQLSADTPAVQALLARATKALRAGQLAGDKDSA